MPPKSERRFDAGFWFSRTKDLCQKAHFRFQAKFPRFNLPVKLHCLLSQFTVRIRYLTAKLIWTA